MTLLVLTALEETWGSDEPLLFLGEWCKRYERRHVWSERTSETVPFHWDDREKLLADYTHLEGLHTRLLEALSRSLNEFHGVGHSIRYWQILLDPWLVAYVAVLFDRWECVRVAMEGRATCTSWFVEDEHGLRPPYSYLEFLEQTQSDWWNQQIYQAILEHAFAERVSARWVSCDRAGKVGGEEGLGTPRSGNKVGVVARIVDRLLAQVSGDYRVVIKQAGFSWSASAKLNFALGQLPRWFYDIGGETVGTPRDPAGDLQARRERLAVAWSPESDFERFLARVLPRDLPTMVIEEFETLSERAGASPLRARVAVTAGSHWTDVGAKFWFAQGVERGMKLLVAEHGGSLPPLKECFAFEEGIADAKCTWFRPYHPKHRQLPASRLLKWSKIAAGASRRRGGCLILANECPRWVHRAQFYPMAGQWITSFEMVLALVDILEEPVRRRTRVKPYPSDQGWNTAARFVDALGADHVLTGRSVDEVFPDTRLVVCTYPETTFAEAMASGVPTVLMYPQRLYELNPVALPLLARLKEAKVVFHDAMSAAAHINRIWDDPDAWWSSELLRRVRAEFREQATDLRGDWLRPWLDLLDEFSH